MGSLAWRMVCCWALACGGRVLRLCVRVVASLPLVVCFSWLVAAAAARGVNHIFVKGIESSNQLMAFL